MKTKLTLLALLISVVAVAQNGINYKAIIKDDLGNVISNSNIDVQIAIEIFSTPIYVETHNVDTNDNGLIMLNIGEGNVVDGTFENIDWKNDRPELNVQVDIGNGYVDLGSTAFKVVPYAIRALQQEGLVEVFEGGNKGWRLSGVDSDNYGDIGENAVDLSISEAASSVLGAIGDYSFASGRFTMASGFASTAMGLGSEASAMFSTALGSSNIASATASTAMGSTTVASGAGSTAMGSFTVASAMYSTAMGTSTIASGEASTAMGIGTNTDAYVSIAIGRYNVGGGNPTQWNDNDPLFEIGNGTSGNNRSNALTVYKIGTHVINSGSNGINMSANGHGLSIFESGASGVIVYDAQDFGGIFNGNIAGVSTRASLSQNPDIILEGNSSANSNDDGILTSDPSYPSSDLYFRSNDGVIIELDDDDNESGSFIVRNGDNNGVFSVDESGTIRQNGSTIHSSDKRLKKDIETLNYGLDEVLMLQPKAYRWKNKNQPQKSLGLIAQEVQPIIQEIVIAQDDANKTLGISYTELIPVLINAIKEQQKIIDNEKSINSKQNSQLETLLSRIEQLESNSSK